TRSKRDWSSDVCSSDLICMKCTLKFPHILSLYAHISGSHKSAFVQDRDIPADIFQFLQSVRSYDYRKFPLFHLLPEEILHHFRRDRIKAVKHFVAQQIFCSCTECED